MNNYGRAGAILTILGSLVMFTASIIFLTGSGFSLVLSLTSGAFYFLTVGAIILSVVNIVLSGLFLSGKTSLFKISGILALISIGFAWIVWFFPLVILLIGGVLLLFNTQERVKEENVVVNNKKIMKNINDTTELDINN